MLVKLTDPFQIAETFTAKWEGGLVDNPNDPGGITKYGASLRWLKSLGHDLGDIDGDGDIDADDVRHMTYEQARELFKSQFWDAYKIEELCIPVAVVYYDTMINTGPKQAGKFMQDAANFYSGKSLVVDGIVGPATRSAVNCVCRNWERTQVMAARMVQKRAAFYIALAVSKPDLAVFREGWLNRCDALQSFILTLSRG